MDGAPAFPLLPAHAQLLQVPQLLYLGLQLLHLGLQALDSLRQPGVGWGHAQETFEGDGAALLTAVLAPGRWRDMGLGTGRSL